MIFNSTIQKSSTANLITFYTAFADLPSEIVGTHHAEKGMTWENFVNSSYNDGTFGILNNRVCVAHGATSPSPAAPVLPNEYIRDNTNYIISYNKILLDESKQNMLIPLYDKQGSGEDQFEFSQSILEKYSYICMSSIACESVCEYDDIVLSLTMDCSTTHWSGIALVYSPSTGSLLEKDAYIDLGGNNIFVKDAVFSSSLYYILLGNY